MRNRRRLQSLQVIAFQPWFLLHLLAFFIFASLLLTQWYLQDNFADGKKTNVLFEAFCIKLINDLASIINLASWPFIPSFVLCIRWFFELLVLVLSTETARVLHAFFVVSLFSCSSIFVLFS